MKRYRGEPLPASSKIAVVANDALGNYVVTTPLVQMLRDTHLPGELHLFSGNRTRELWQNEPLIDRGIALYGAHPRETARIALENDYALIVNVEATAWAKAVTAIAAGPETYVCGPALGPAGRDDLPFPDDATGELWSDREWISSGILAKYPFLQSGFIGEIFARLAYLGGPLPPYRVPSDDPGREIPDVLIATAASLPEKLWPNDHWAATLQVLKTQGVSVGLIGAPPAQQREFWKGESVEQSLVDAGLVQDLRGAFGLPQVVGALARAKVVLTLDNGILHLATASGTPTVGLFRHGIHRLWAPPFEGLTVLTAGEGREVREIPIEEVLGAVRRAL